MDVVLGISMSSAAVRAVLVEGDSAQGRIVDHETIVLDQSIDHDAKTLVVAAVRGTRNRAMEGGHEVVRVGVEWTDYEAAAELRDALGASGIHGVELVSELEATGALAKAVSYTDVSKTVAVAFADDERVALTSIDALDGTVLSSEHASLDPESDVAEQVAGLAQTLQFSPTQVTELIVIGPREDIAEIASTVATHIAVPVSSPDWPDLAIARGAALAAVLPTTIHEEEPAPPLAYSEAAPDAAVVPPKPRRNWRVPAVIAAVIIALGFGTGAAFAYRASQHNDTTETETVRITPSVTTAPASATTTTLTTTPTTTTSSSASSSASVPERTTVRTVVTTVVTVTTETSVKTVTSEAPPAQSSSGSTAPSSPSATSSQASDTPAPADGE